MCCHHEPPRHRYCCLAVLQTAARDRYCGIFVLIPAAYTVVRLLFMRQWTQVLLSCPCPYSWLDTGCQVVLHSAGRHRYCCQAVVVQNAATILPVGICCAPGLSVSARSHAPWSRPLWSHPTAAILPLPPRKQNRWSLLCMRLFVLVSCLLFLFL